MLEKASKYAGWITAVLVALASGVGFIFDWGASTASTEGKVFDSPEQKVYVVEHVEKAPTPEQIWKKYLQDSIKEREVAKSRRRRDSIMIEELKARKKADSINYLNAVQMSQIKAELKVLKDKIE